MSKVVFVGNVPYNMGEEQLIDVFKTVGQVVGFRLVFDRDTGKPRGYGFCEFADHETASSAVRNLNGVDVGGRPLRIDLADSDPFLEGKTTVRGELIDGGEPRPRGARVVVADDVPPGVPIPPGMSALDAITQTLAPMNPTQLMEVLAQFKAYVITYTEQARSLLVAHPQLAYALFQGLLIYKIVDPAILQRMLAATSAASNASSQPTAPPATPQSISHQMYPPQQAPPQTLAAPQPVLANMYGGPVLHQQASAPPPQIQAQPQHSYYQAPTPQAPTIMQSPPTASTAVSTSVPPDLNIDPAQRAMLMQVLSLTPEQIGALPAAERDAIQQLRTQFARSGNI